MEFNIVSRRTETAYKAEEADECAQHHEVQGCASTVNAAVVQLCGEPFLRHYLLRKLSALRFGRSYPGRPVTHALRQRRASGSAMMSMMRQESAEGIVPSP